VAGFDVIAARDVTALVDVAAVRAASGCTDGISCESEIASALDAPQLVTGELGRVGDTWLLSLARTERTTSSVLARVTVDARGDTPEGLLGEIDGAVAELFGAEVAGGVDVGFVVGAVGVGVGVGGLVVAPPQRCGRTCTSRRPRAPSPKKTTPTSARRCRPRPRTSATA
jgi:hypothetical protein